MSDPLGFAIDLGEIRTRLGLMNYFLTIEDVLEASEALDGTIVGQPPAAFVAVNREAAEPNRLVGGQRQRVNVELGVLFVESAARMDRRSQDQLERTRKALIRQLIGWKPSAAQAALQYVRYRIVTIGGGLAWGEVAFSASYFLSLES